MRGAALYFAEKTQALPDAEAPSVLLASDYLNLAEWRALAAPAWARAPAVLYFHENQATYPLSPEAPRDTQFAWINLASALAADKVLFNSEYHRTAFLRAVDEALGRMPEPAVPNVLERLVKGSSVFPVGIDFRPHRRFLPEPLTPRERSAERPPLLLWNHRWEADKAPEVFVAALCELVRRGVAFRVAIAGEGPPTGAAAPLVRLRDGLHQALGERLEHCGFVSEPEDYYRLLSEADFVVSSARHEFFGISVVEAMFFGCLPIVPDDLSYPELVPRSLWAQCLYRRETNLADAIEKRLVGGTDEDRHRVHEAAVRYDWARLAPQLDDTIEAVRSGEVR